MSHELTITWLSKIKDVRCKPELGISWSMAALLRDLVKSTLPRSMPLAMLTISMYGCGSVPLVMAPCLMATRAAGTPLLE